MFLRNVCTISALECCARYVFISLPPPRHSSCNVQLSLLIVALQAIKFFDLLRYWFFSDGQQSFARKWMLVDFLYCASLVKLRIPRLRYSISVVLLQILSLWVLDAFMFGAVTIHVGDGGSWKSLSSVRISGMNKVFSACAAIKLGFNLDAY